MQERLGKPIGANLESKDYAPRVSPQINVQDNDGLQYLKRQCNKNLMTEDKKSFLSSVMGGSTTNYKKRKRKKKAITRFKKVLKQQVKNIIIINNNLGAEWLGGQIDLWSKSINIDLRSIWNQISLPVSTNSSTEQAIIDKKSEPTVGGLMLNRSQLMVRYRQFLKPQ